MYQGDRKAQTCDNMPAHPKAMCGTAVGPDKGLFVTPAERGEALMQQALEARHQLDRKLERIARQLVLLSHEDELTRTHQTVRKAARVYQ